MRKKIKIEKVSIKEFIQILKINFLSNKILIDELIKKKIDIKNIIAISSGAAKSNKDKNIESVKKFQDLYRLNKISYPKLIARKIINFLGNLKEIDSGFFIDLREY